MREIKFRGKRVDNGEWVKGYYCFIGYTNMQKHFIIPDYASAFYGFEVDPSTVGQYTGLYDKNGKEIYEGNKLLYVTTNSMSDMVVKFIDGCFVGEGPFNARPLIEYIKAPDFESIEVIGDIHDNPELLKGAE